MFFKYSVDLFDSEVIFRGILTLSTCTSGLPEGET